MDIPGIHYDTNLKQSRGVLTPASNPLQGRPSLPLFPPSSPTQKPHLCTGCPPRPLPLQQAGHKQYGAKVTPNNDIREPDTRPTTSRTRPLCNCPRKHYCAREPTPPHAMRNGRKKWYRSALHPSSAHNISICPADTHNNYPEHPPRTSTHPFFSIRLVVHGRPTPAPPLSFSPPVSLPAPSPSEIVSEPILHRPPHLLQPHIPLPLPPSLLHPRRMHRHMIRRALLPPQITRHRLIRIRTRRQGALCHRRPRPGVTVHNGRVGALVAVVEGVFGRALAVRHFEPRWGAGRWEDMCGWI